MRVMFLTHRAAGDEARRFCLKDIAAADTAALIDLIAAADVVCVVPSTATQVQVINGLDDLTVAVEDIEDWEGGDHHTA